MNQNYDEVKVDLAAPEQTNLLAGTSQMQDADETDHVSKIEILGESTGIVLEYRVKPKSNEYLPARERFANDSVLTFEIRKDDKHMGQLFFNTQLGTVELSADVNRDALVGSYVTVRVTRDNYNRRPRSTARTQ